MVMETLRYVPETRVRGDISVQALCTLNLYGRMSLCVLYISTKYDDR